MNGWKMRSGLAAAIALAGCGGAAPEPAPAPVATAEPAPVAAVAVPSVEDVKMGVPTACDETRDGVCLPSARFVKRLCASLYPEVALQMFGKGTPWTRGYLKGDVEAWNASGGASSAEKLVFDEEVIVVRRRTAASTGLQVSGTSGTYDVLRWDGSCASLTDSELTRKAPPTKAKAAKIPFRNLDEETREALEKDDKVGRAITARRDACKGAAMGEVPPKCAKADEAMSAVVVDYVRAGGSIPTPARTP